jgi:NAD(P)H-hydrate repair Nnr-like enzyme with NAD(P)H-hydrate epimerase domain
MLHRTSRVWAGPHRHWMLPPGRVIPGRRAAAAAAASAARDWYGVTESPGRVTGTDRAARPWRSLPVAGPGDHGPDRLVTARFLSSMLWRCQPLTA